MTRKRKLTWDELADLYHQHTGGQARIKPMDAVFEWAESRADLFKVNSDGTLSLAGRREGRKS